MGGVQTNAHVTSPIDKCPEVNVGATVGVWEPEPSLKDANPDCIGYFLDTKVDAEGKISHNPNFDTVIQPFPNLTGINAFKVLKTYLESRGYTDGKDILGVNYDWILYPLGTPDLFSQLKQNIEASHKESGMKVVLIGHSLGTHVLRSFVTHAMTTDWVKEHIDGVIFNAPAFLGCGGVFDYIMKDTFSSLKPSQYLAEVVQKMPSVQALFDNYAAFSDTVVFKDYPGVGDVLASGVKDFLVKVGKFSTDAQEIFKQIESSLQETPQKPPVRALVLYNSGIPTVVGYSGENFSDINGGGDGVCHSGGPEYVCRTWEGVECVDWNRNDSVNWGHTPMLHQEEALDKIYKFLTLNNEKEPSSSDDKEIKTLTIVLVSLSAVTAVLLVVLVVLLVLYKKH